MMIEAQQSSSATDNTASVLECEIDEMRFVFKQCFPKRKVGPINFGGEVWRCMDSRQNARSTVGKPSRRGEILRIRE